MNERERHIYEIMASAHHPQVNSIVIWENGKIQAECYFNGFMPDFTPPLAPQGTPFRLDVWEILREIPYGATISYGAIAARLAADRGLSRMSAQAVGGAVGHNPIALIIPYHRVVGADGSLTGYAAGLDRKDWLLRWENAHCY